MEADTVQEKQYEGNCTELKNKKNWTECIAKWAKELSSQ